MRKLKVFALWVSNILFFSLLAAAQTPPFHLLPFLSGLNSPVFITNAKDGTKRLFVVEQGGIIKAVQPYSNATSVFMNISSKIVAGGEQGLLGLAFHPQFATNHYFFVNYTRVADGATVIARYTATNNNTLGDPNSERIVLVIPQPFANHNGGMIEFRQDGGVYNLYIGMGDGGSANDPNNNAQNINSLLGKFLRITPDVSGNDANPPYTVPADNPYVGVDGADEIYAIGMRNPYRWSFDRGGTNQLWAADVGQSAREEVDIITNGGNYGWRIMEGTICNPNYNNGVCTPPAGYIAPVFDYGHTNGRCAIIGGYVYRGTQGTLPNGTYIYGDYCSHEIFSWNGSAQNVLLNSGRNISSFGEDEDGELYVVGLGGTVDKISGASIRSKDNADFDGDLKTDISVFRPSNGTWYLLESTNGLTGVQFGQNGDLPVPKDFDGDGKTDVAVFRPSNGTWYYIRSSNNTFAGVQFGQNGDLPAAGDYDGDGKADIAVYRPSNGTWYLNQSTKGFAGVQFGASGDVPTPADFDGDGKTDVAVYRPSNGTWYYIHSAGGTMSGVQFGASGDIPTPADFDGDGKIDQAVFRPSNGTWYVLGSTKGFSGVQFGQNGDVPVVGDYDGDGKADIAVFRSSNGTWYLQQSTAGFKGVQFGQNGDLPAPAYDIP